jgi:hypothetical protein
MRQLEQFVDPPLKAIVGLTADLGRGICQGVREASRDDVSVYAVDLVPELLHWFYETGSPLRAICGTEFYSYGRVVARAALIRGWNEKILIPPIVLTKDAVHAMNIVVTHDLLEHFPQLRFNEEKYAWVPAFKDSCPNDYGPDLAGHAESVAP